VNEWLTYACYAVLAYGLLRYVRWLGREEAFLGEVTYDPSSVG